MNKLIITIKRLISNATIKGSNSRKVKKNDILIITANSDIKQSIVCQATQKVLEDINNRQSFNYKIINLYDYNIPIYRLNRKIPRSFVDLTKLLNQYSKYIFIFPVWYSNVPGVLKNFIDWSGYWGTKRNTDGKLVGTLKGKKAAIIASCWDTRKKYLHDLAASIEYQIVESVFGFFKIENLITLIVEDAHNQSREYLSTIENKIESLVILMNKK